MRQSNYFISPSSNFVDSPFSRDWGDCTYPPFVEFLFKFDAIVFVSLYSVPFSIIIVVFLYTLTYWLIYKNCKNLFKKHWVRRYRHWVLFSLFVGCHLRETAESSHRLFWYSLLYYAGYIAAILNDYIKWWKGRKTKGSNCSKTIFSTVSVTAESIVLSNVSVSPHWYLVMAHVLR